MHSLDALARLDDHQSAVRQQLTGAIERAGRPGVQGTIELAQMRWHLFRLLRAYQIFKHVEIFEPFARSADARRAAAARDLKAACLRASEDFTAFALHWTAERSAAEPSCFREATLAMASSVEQHLVEERAGVVRLVAGTSRTRTG